MSQDLRDILTTATTNNGLVVFLTGAGVSAASGIPTFRGPEGYWTVGSRVYQSQEMATSFAFGRMPEEVWRWYLYRRSVCRTAQPNSAHLALADLEKQLRDRFLLVTQNVDGLHLRAGNSAGRTYQIHGNVDFMRCARGCTNELTPLPEQFANWQKETEFASGEFDLLACPCCAGPARPHVLWFDECYDEALYRFESSLAAAARADVLITVGTSGATNLPVQMFRLAMGRGAWVIDINPEPNPFADAVSRISTGHWVKGAAMEVVPDMCRILADSAS